MTAGGWQIQNIGKIIDMKIVGEISNNLRWLYRFKTIKLNKHEVSKVWISERYIKRKLTEEEIKDFEIELDTIKYNI